MTQTVTQGLRLFGITAVSSAILGGVAWGTRFISRIPTQDPASAAIVSAMGTVTAVMLMHMPCLGLKKDNSTKDNTIMITTAMLTILVPTAITPRLAPLMNCSISCPAAAAFGVVNLFSFIMVAVGSSYFFPKK